MRYHSLLVEEGSLPDCLEPIAWTCGEHHALQLAGAGAGEVATCGGAAPTAAPGGAAPARRRQPQQDGGGALLMALAHRSLPHYGVQFHPESVATGHGLALLRNFAALTWRHRGLPVPPLPPTLLAQLAGGSFSWPSAGVEQHCGPAIHGFPC